MSDSIKKYEELMEEGKFQSSEEAKIDVLLFSLRNTGFRQQVMLTAIDMVRNDTTLTNEEAIIKAAKHFNVI
jgi:hypothetical protein